jgi:hypothetical protein
VGTWRALDGPDGILPPEIADLAGSSDHWLRIYQDEKTGERVNVLVLYGMATSVFAHRPEICFTGAGFQTNGPARDEKVTVESSNTPVRYRLAYFAKSSGPVQQQVEVCHSFFHNREWLPYLDSRWKMFRQHPAMCKIQIERFADSTSLETSPSVSLLAGLADAIDRRLADAEKSQLTATATTSVTAR